MGTDWHTGDRQGPPTPTLHGVVFSPKRPGRLQTSWEVVSRRAGTQPPTPQCWLGSARVSPQGRDPLGLLSKLSGCSILLSKEVPPWCPLSRSPPVVARPFVPFSFKGLGPQQGPESLRGLWKEGHGEQETPGGQAWVGRCGGPCSRGGSYGWFSGVRWAQAEKESCW